MSAKKPRNWTPSPAAAKAQLRPRQIERLVEQIASALPLLEKKAFSEAIEEIKQRPRASLQYLFECLSSGDATRRAIASMLLPKIGGVDIIDSCNAVIFDISQEPTVKVAANSILKQLGAAIDPDIFAMTVPESEKLERKLPGEALSLLKRGDTAAAVSHARAMRPAERWLMMYAAAESVRDQAVQFLGTLARDDAANATAAATAIAAEKLAAGAPLLLELQRSLDKELQKIVKRLIFELRKSGVQVPEEKQQSLPVVPETAEEESPLHRALASEPSPSGLILVAVARSRPHGRLKVFSVVVGPWKRGIQQAGLRLDMSKSSFDRFLSMQASNKLKMHDISLEDCRKIVARGVRVAREFDSPLPFDFGMGRSMLGDLDSAIAAINDPFLCAECSRPLDPESVERIKAVAAYENIPPEKRCVDCRSQSKKT